MRRRRETGDVRVDVQMTPMIDIVFQLLVFFIMSFKVTVQEGDFNVKMPVAAPSAGVIEEELPPMKLRLTANADGTLSGIRLNDQSFPNFAALRQHVLQLLGSDQGPGSMREKAELEIDADFGLQYDQVVRALTAVTGYIQNDQPVKLIEKIRFTPPRE
ncbi:MAG: biopolymer transporter ExbD [Pirellulales bacterium]